MLELKINKKKSNFAKNILTSEVSVFINSNSHNEFVWS